MTKDEFLSGVASVKREMCEQIVALAHEYVKDTENFCEFEADGIRLKYENSYITHGKWNLGKGVGIPKELVLTFHASIQATFPYVQTIKIK